MEDDYGFMYNVPEQSPLTEDEIIHSILSYVVTKLPKKNLMQAIDPTWVCSRANIDIFLNLTMSRMVSEGLITSERSNHSGVGYLIRATPHGIRVAQHPGGYQAYRAGQHQVAVQERWAKLEAERLNQEAARATISAAGAASQSVKVSERAMRVSIVGIVLPSAIAIAALIAQVVSSNNSAAELALVKKQVKELRQQVTSLTVRPRHPKSQPLLRTN